MKKLILFPALLMILIVASCGKKNESNINEVVKNYFVEQEVAVFGKIDINEIQEAAQLDNIPILGAMVNAQLDEIKKGIDMKSPVFFGAKYIDNTAQVVAFAKTLYKDSLKSTLSAQGYSFETIYKMFVTEQDGMVLAFDDNIIALQVGDKVNAKSFVATINQSKEGKINNQLLAETIQKTIDKKSPIVFTVSLDELNNIDFNKFLDLPITTTKADEQNKDLFQSFDIQFNKGSIDISTETIGDKKQLEKLNYLGNSAAVKNFKLSGNDAAYLAMNINLAKIEQERKGLLASIFKEIGESQSGLDAFISKEHPLTSIMTGDVFVSAQPNSSNYSEPSIQFYVGSTNSELKKHITNMLLDIDKNAKIDITEKSIQGMLFTTKDVNLSKHLDVSKNMIKVYADMNYIASIATKMDEQNGLYLKPYKSIVFDVDKNSAKLSIKLNDDSKNALAYLVQYYASLLLMG